MRRNAFLPRISILLLLSAASFSLACGSGSSSQHLLQSISVSPAVANGSQVQFVASGTYNNAPVTVDPLDAGWGVAAAGGTGPTTGVSIDANGLAQCQTSGTYSIGAWDIVNAKAPTCSLVGPYGNPACNAVLGTAQLTCP